MPQLISTNGQRNEETERDAKKLCIIMTDLVTLTESIGTFPDQGGSQIIELMFSKHIAVTVSILLLNVLSELQSTKPKRCKVLAGVIAALCWKCHLLSIRH